MPDLPEAPSPWQSPAASEPAPAHNAAVAQRLRSQVLRIVVITMAVVALLAVGGIVAAAAYASWAVLIGAGVAVFCIAAVLIAATTITSAVRTHAEGFSSAAPVRYVSAPSAPSAPGTPSAPGPAEPVDQSTFDSDPEQRREVFGKLARRLQSLVNRAIQRVDGLEREIEDPDLLRGLYEIDHLATRVRRQAENLAVLGGGSPQRRSNQPVSIYAVLRSAVAEIEHYKQVSIVPVEGISLRGHAVAEIIHLLAELLENATTFTAPDAAKVVLRVHKVTAGLAVEIQDRGLGMTRDDLQRINLLLEGTATIDLADLLSDGRIGMAVVKELARRHDIRVQLQTNIFGGIDAAVVLPHTLISEPAQETTREQPSVLPQQQRPEQLPQHEPQHRLEPLSQRAESAPQHQLQQRQAAPRPAAPQPGGWDPQQATPAASVAAITGAPNVPPASTPFNAWQEPSSPQTDAHPGYPSAAPQAALPVRTPGGSTAGDSTTGELGRANPPAEALPPLPQRRGSHLRPELLQAPSAPTKPLPGHNTNLMAVVQQGFDRAREAQNTESNQSLKQHRTTEGESEASWPTT